MGHMNVMWYAAKFDEACWQLLSWLGMSSSRMRTDRVGMAAVEQRIEYRREVFGGDLISIRSRVLDVKEKSVRMRHEMINDETKDLVATMEVVGVHLNFPTRRSCPLPPDLRERAAAMIVGGSTSCLTAPGATTNAAVTTEIESRQPGGTPHL